MHLPSWLLRIQNISARPSLQPPCVAHSVIIRLEYGSFSVGFGFGTFHLMSFRRMYRPSSLGFLPILPLSLSLIS